MLTDPFGIVAYDCDIRDDDAPPSDGLAACVCLYHCLFEPSTIDRVDLGPLLTFPEHRELWRVLCSTRARCKLDDGGFYVAWLAALQTAQPAKWPNYLDLILSVADRESVRAWAEYDADHHDRPYTTYLHGFDWWLARLRRIAEARRGIAATQKIADQWWHAPDVPFDGAAAVAILEKAVPPERPTLADRVFHL